MSEHESHDCEPIIEPLEIRDIVGIIVGTAGAMIGNLSQGVTLLSAEFMSAGRYARYRKMAAQQRREAGYDLERIVEGDR